MADITTRTVPAVHGNEKVIKDPQFEKEFSQHLLTLYSADSLVELYSRFKEGEGQFDFFMRRAIWRALAKSFGNNITICPGACFKYLGTMEIGDNVFIGNQAFLQGRFDGRCIVKDHVWIGPNSYLDARDLIIDEYVGWGPGAKILGSSHSALPIDIPTVKTDLIISTVHIQAESDIGVNAVILPGITVGKGSIVGAGAIVAKDVPPYAVVAGVPAKFLHWREGFVPNE